MEDFKNDKGAQMLIRTINLDLYSAYQCTNKHIVCIRKDNDNIGLCPMCKHKLVPIENIKELQSIYKAL